MSQLKYRRVTLALAMLAAALAASPAQASKPKPKKPKYTATIDATVHMDAFLVCEDGWTTDWVFHGTYAPTTLTSAATLDAVTRTGSGTIQWTRQQTDGNNCVDGETGTCSLGVETPIPDSAGYEDASLHKTAGGFRVETIVDNAFLVLGDSDCHGSYLWGLNREYADAQYTEPQGVIPSSAIGKKTITVALAGSLHGADSFGNRSDGQFNGTLTLTRKGKR
jgi:hypothetical protein